MKGERTAIVTGAGRRVGRDIATALVADGWSVIAHVHHDLDDVPAGAIKVVADLEDLSCADFDLRRCRAGAARSPLDQ